MKPNVEAEDFLTANCSIFSLHYYRTVVATPSKAKEYGYSSTNIPTDVRSELTDRQNLILRLISEDRTNSNISESLGYSESTIRQESMKIFAKLGCSHRGEATAIYKSYSEKGS